MLAGSQHLTDSFNMQRRDSRLRIEPFVAFHSPLTSQSRTILKLGMIIGDELPAVPKKAGRVMEF